MTSLLIPSPTPLTEAEKRARAVQVMIFDVDGVLTDGRLYYDQNGEALKTFHVLDGHGFKMLHRAGIQTALISGRDSPIVTRRAQELGVAWIKQGVEDKYRALEELCATLQVSPEICGYMGDDIIDLPILTRVRFAATVPQAHVLVFKNVHWVATQNGGQGAVREVCDFLLSVQGKLEKLQNTYLE